MDSQDDSVRLIRDALKAKQKKNPKTNKGRQQFKQSGRYIRRRNQHVQKEILGNQNPEALLYTLWLKNGIHFGLRGDTEHYNLRWGGGSN